MKEQIKIFGEILRLQHTVGMLTEGLLKIESSTSDGDPANIIAGEYIEKLRKEADKAIKELGEWKIDNE